MRKFFLIVAIFLYSVFSAQTTSDFGKIPLVVHLPDDFPYSQYDRMENKLTQIVSNSGMASYGYGNFVIYPKLDIQNTNVVEGGMQNIVVANIGLNLFIAEANTGKIFSSYAVNLKGSGRNEDMAVADAINQIQTSAPKFKAFIEKGKENILSHYNFRCNTILTDIENLHNKKDYEGALALAMSVPEEATSCYDKAQQKSLVSYKSHQSQQCSQNIQYANALIVQKDYDSALGILVMIDNSMPCFTESRRLISSIESKIKAEDEKQWNYMVKMQEDANALEKRRINAMRDIAKEYYKSQKRDIYIVK